MISSLAITKFIWRVDDILIAREDILLIGNGMRTSSQGIDMLVNRLCKSSGPEKRHIIVQQLPSSPESFIHLDMVFTLLDVDKARFLTINTW